LWSFADTVTEPESRRFLTGHLVTGHTSGCVWSHRCTDDRYTPNRMANASLRKEKNDKTEPLDHNGYSPLFQGKSNDAMLPICVGLGRPSPTCMIATSIGSGWILRHFLFLGSSWSFGDRSRWPQNALCWSPKGSIAPPES